MSAKIIQNQIANHLTGGEAFMPLVKMLADIDLEQVGIRPHDLPYSIFELMHHIAFAQKDILNFCSADEYKPHNWPQDYWPKKQHPESAQQWHALIEGYLSDRDTLSEICINANDLSAKARTGVEQTLIRELLLVIEHTAYHTGQIMVLIRLVEGN